MPPREAETMDLTTIPEWIGAAVFGAAIALIGYVGKVIVEAVRAARETERARRASLVELHSLFGASRVTFLIQNQHARNLVDSIRSRRTPGADLEHGLEQALASAYFHLSPEQLEVHNLVRGMTIHAMYPTNQAMLGWLRRDRFYKAHPASDELYGSLAQGLARLEAHIVLWLAKYEAWIPDSPEHALVYLADENRHGLGFPTGIDLEVARLLGLDAPGHDSRPN
jgi:hypothetical protein